jgi:uncharacterized protein YebE (UPF0316 family)
MDFPDTVFFNMFLIPLLICLARITDVSIGTIKIIFIAKGYRYIAPFLAFAEIIIWLLAISQVMKNLDNIPNVIGYAVGFSIGNFVGMAIEGRIALGNVVIRVITKSDSDDLVFHLRQTNYGVTASPAEGANGPVSVIFMVIKRSDLKNVVPIIKEHNPNAFYSIEDVRYVSEGVFPRERSRLRGLFNMGKSK